MEALKGSLTKKRETRATTPKIADEGEEEGEEDIENNVTESGSDCISVASSRFKSN